MELINLRQDTMQKLLYRTLHFFNKLNIHKTWFTNMVKNSKDILLSSNIFDF
jgi:hypothetical protein